MIYKIIQRRQSRTRNREAGQALALAAVSLTVLLLAAGLAIDMGFLRYQRRRIQSAADSAAIAGAGEVNYGDIQTAAQNDAALNGFTDGTANTTVTVSCSATLTGGFGSGCSTGTPYVQVGVAQKEPLFFMKIIPGITSPTVSAQAVGYLGSGPNCMYALGANGIVGPAGLQTTINTSCAIMSNGPIDIQDCVTQFSATSIGYYTEGFTASGCPLPAPNPQQIVAQSADPLSYLTPPGAPGSCPPGSTSSYGSLTGAPIMYPPIPPGSYPCGIQIIGNAVVTFTPGTYVLAGGLTISGNNNSITGNGVTFYTANGAISICASPNENPSPAPAGTGCVNDYTGDQINLSAPTTGTYEGILFYQDPRNYAPAIIVGNDMYGTTFTTYLEGAFYFPSAQLTLAELTDGAGWASTYTAVVANSITLIGTVQFGDGTTYLKTLANGSPIKDAVLVQ